MNDKQSKQRITVTIANRSYTLYVEREKLEEQEPLSRRAAELINTRAAQYDKQFKKTQGVDLQDILAMASWDIAYDYLRLSSTKDAELLVEELNFIDAGLESYLQQTGTVPEEDC